jgi:phage shock protein E
MVEGRKVRIALALLACGTLLAAACTSTTAAPETGAEGDGVASTCSGGELPPGQAWELIQSGATVIDVRTDADYAAGHVPGALLISRSAADYMDLLEALPRDATYVVICVSGAASHATVQDMMALGFTTACSVEGGYTAWEAAGLPLETGAAEGAMQPEETGAVECAGGSVTIEEAQQLMQTGATTIDVRDLADYEVGHMPGAILVSRSAEDYAEKLSALPRDVKYVVYCSCSDDGSSRATVVDMVSLGFSSACSIEGGFPKWQAAGLPFDRGAQTTYLDGRELSPLLAWSLIWDGATVIDVRPAADYEAGHVPNALLITRDTLPYQEMLESLPRDIPYVVICKLGIASHKTVEDMMALGFAMTGSVLGGYSAWTGEGLPLDMGPLTMYCDGSEIDPLLAWNIIQHGAEVIDVRTLADYEAGHVPGAQLISREADDYQEQLDALPRDEEYVVICALGAASHQTVLDMMALGFPTVCSVAGGYSAWEAIGLPLEMGAP